MATLSGIDEDHLVALDRSGERKPDAGVARGRLDDRPARPQLPGALGLVDHRERDPVLVRAARVQVLELREQGGAELGADLLEPDDRRVADQVEQGGVLARHLRREAYVTAGPRPRTGDDWMIEVVVWP